jgi:hypothetical protein
MSVQNYDIEAREMIDEHLDDWVQMAEDVFGITLDTEQKNILAAIQYGHKVSIVSGTSRGKDFILAVAAMCFLYSTPVWDEKGNLIEETKVFLIAPTERQIENIMAPEIAKLHGKAQARGFNLPGRLVGNGIRTENKEWFLTGFKADDNNTEAWTGLHAPNIAFFITEGSGISKTIFDAIEGNLQGNSRLAIAFNDNTGTGYAADTQTSPDWAKFRLNSLNATNVKAKRIIIPGQVDWVWIDNHVRSWCKPVIDEESINETDGDFFWEGTWYKPNDLFRVKVLGLAPRVSTDVLVPKDWIRAANERWEKFNRQQLQLPTVKFLRLGVDVSGMGNDTNCFCPRYGDYVEPFEIVESFGEAKHMQIAGITVNRLKKASDSFHGINGKAFIDTIGEGGGVFSRVEEVKTPQDIWQAFSVKFSSAPNDKNGNPIQDKTGQYTFLNKRALLYWKVRDWLNPEFNSKAMLPPNEKLEKALSSTMWRFRSDGSIQLEAKEKVKKKLGWSPDEADALALTFEDEPDKLIIAKGKKNVANYFSF